MSDALGWLAQRRAAILAGGTDFYPARVGRPVVEDVLDLCALAELKGIREAPDRWRIGALATWTEILQARLPPWFSALKLAAREIGGMQTQNAGTLAGNVCNASPAADGVPVLLAMDAEVELRSATRTRVLALADFVVGARRTARAPDELVCAILVPKRSGESRSTFLKLGARKYLVIAIASVAVVLDLADDGSIARAAIAVGACSPVVRRLHALERELVGRKPGELSVLPRHLAPLSPMSDVRGTAEYRSDAVITLLGRALEDLGHE